MLSLLAVSAVAQDTRPARDPVREAVRRAEALRRQDRLAEAAAVLEQAEGQIDALPDPAARPKALLVVRALRATLLGNLGSGRRDAAADLCVRARDAARAAGVWALPELLRFRVMLLLALWEAAAADLADAVLREEATGLLAPGPLAQLRGDDQSRALVLPFCILRGYLLLRSGRSQECFAALQAVLGEVETSVDGHPVLRPEALSAAWYRRLIQLFDWWCQERRDWQRRKQYLQRLPEAEARLPLAMVAWQEGDYDTMVRLGLLLEQSDPGLAHVTANGLEGRREFAAAEAAYRRGLPHARSAHDRALYLDGLGDLALARGDLPSAEQDYAASLAAAEEAREPEALLEAWRDRGRLCEARGDRAGARAAFARALAPLEELRERLGIDVLGDHLLQRRFLRPLDGILRTLVGAPDAGARALETMERGKSRGLADWLRAPRDAWSAEALQDLRWALARVAAARGVEETAQRMPAVERARARLPQGARAATPEQAAALLLDAATTPGTHLLWYWWAEDPEHQGDDHAYLVEGPPRADALRLHDLGATAKLHPVVHRAAQLVADPDSDPAAVAAALAAAAHVLLPDAVRSALPSAQLLVISPDKELAGFPFEALPVAGDLLGVRWPVELAPSLAVRAVLEARPLPSADAPVLVLDAPVAAPAPGAGEARDPLPLLDLPPLQFSAVEGERVAAAYGPRARRCSGPAATLRGLLELGQSCAVVHLSTHAVEVPGAPAESFLILADGPAPMPSLLGLKAPAALVVLAACSTARGEARGGEGNPGLLWGAFGTGARTVVASRWPAGQQATTDLMTQFHFHRARGVPEAEALRRARARLAAAPQYAHPFHWASFAVFGPGTVAVVATGPAWGLWAAGGALALIAALGLTRAVVRRRCRTAAAAR